MHCLPQCAFTQDRSSNTRTDGAARTCNLGKVKAAACAGCHGAEGVSENLPGPSLAGQNEAYLVEALKAYRTGARDIPMMSAAVRGASDDDIQNIAAYYSGLKCESTLTAERQATHRDVAAGPDNVARCSAVSVLSHFRPE